MSPYFQREDDQYVEQLKSQANKALLVVQSMTKERDALAARCRELEAALRNLRSRFGAPIDYHDPTYDYLHAADAALASSGGTGAATRLVDWRKCIDCGHEWPFPIETSHMRCPQCYNRLGVAEGRAGLREPANVVRRSFETLAATRDMRATGLGETARPSTPEAAVTPTAQDGGSVALPSREQAGRADSSASDVERAEKWLTGRGAAIYTHVDVSDLAAEFAAIRREAIEAAAQLIEKESHAPGAQGYSGDPKFTDMRMLAKRIRALAGDAPAERV